MLSRNPTHRPTNVSAFSPRKADMLKARRTVDRPMGLPARASVIINS